MSGVIRTSVRSRRRWRMSSCPAAMGMRCVKPSSATVSPSWTSSETAVPRETMVCALCAIVLIPHTRGPGVSMSLRTSPPFRADHVGSLLRPPELHEAREAHAADHLASRLRRRDPDDTRAAHAPGKLEDECVKSAEDTAIDEVVRMQEEVGL